MITKYKIKFGNEIAIVSHGLPGSSRAEILVDDLPTGVDAIESQPVAPIVLIACRVRWPRATWPAHVYDDDNLAWQSVELICG
jgi:hypothetical protein